MTKSPLRVLKAELAAHFGHKGVAELVGVQAVLVDPRFGFCGRLRAEPLAGVIFAAAAGEVRWRGKHDVRRPADRTAVGRNILAFARGPDWVFTRFMPTR